MVLIVVRIVVVVVIVTILIHSVLLIILEASLTRPLRPIEKLAHAHVCKVGHVGIDLVLLLLLERRGDRLVRMRHQSVQPWWLPDWSVRQWQRSFIGRLDNRFQPKGGQEPTLVSAGGLRRRQVLGVETYEKKSSRMGPAS